MHNKEFLKGLEGIQWGDRISSSKRIGIEHAKTVAVTERREKRRVFDEAIPFPDQEQYLVGELSRKFELFTSRDLDLSDYPFLDEQVLELGDTEEDLVIVTSLIRRLLMELVVSNQEKERAGLANVATTMMLWSVKRQKQFPSIQRNPTVSTERFMISALADARSGSIHLRQKMVNEVADKLVRTEHAPRRVARRIAKQCTGETADIIQDVVQRILCYCDDSHVREFPTTFASASVDPIPTIVPPEDRQRLLTSVSEPDALARYVRKTLGKVIDYLIQMLPGIHNPSVKVENAYTQAYLAKASAELFETHRESLN